MRLKPPTSDLERTRQLELLSRIAAVVASDLKLESVVQTVTDAATELTGAQLGAFFSNRLDRQGERYQLYALSGAPHSAFDAFGMPRNTAIFEPTFRGTGVVRSDDIRTDPRYGKSAPHFGPPTDHPPVVSYLAVPVVSRTGETHGGLFFGHEQVGMFTPEMEQLIVGVAAQAALALDSMLLLTTAQRLALIVESSDDAIVSTDTEGLITTWNRGAERLLGYRPEEVIGRPIMMLIPPEREDEEPAIIEQILRGEHIEHYETVRMKRNGERVDVSLTVSPIRDHSGAIVGVSKIGRDISERKRAEDQQRLLIGEMNHRIKNLFAVAAGIVGAGARSATTAKELADTAQARLAALGRANELTLACGNDALSPPRPAQLGDLVEAILAPYEDGGERVRINGPAIECGTHAASNFALMLHEFATNCVKYGALSRPEGKLAVTWRLGPDFVLTWAEHQPEPIEAEVGKEGFGSRLVKASSSALSAELIRDWRPNGLVITLTAPTAALEN